MFSTERIRSYAKEQLISLLSLLIVFGALAALSIFFFAGERKRSLLYVEFAAEESAFALLDYYRQGMTPEPDELERITGFAIYNADGTAAISAGRYPGQLDIEDVIRKGSVFTVNRETDTVSIAKPLGMFPAFMAPPAGATRMRGMSRQPHSAAIYVEISVPDLLSPVRWFTVAQIGIPLLLAVGFTLIGFLLIRNWEYRQKIDSQRHLVHLGEAARTLSHEIKNPLSAIQIQAAILKRTLPEEAGESSRIIDEEVQRLRVLTERVGEFLKNPMGTPELFDAGEFVTELVGKLPWRVESSRIGDAAAVVRVDRERFRSVVENIVRNAAESASAPPPITVTVAAQRSFVTIVVEDEGSGISPDDQNRIFEPFFTTKDSGTGIGLSISRRFVEVAGGSISLAPRATGGTTAQIKLPRCGE
jgi:two-component system, NtrC family, sensor histidine kinase HydH